MFQRILMELFYFNIFKVIINYKKASWIWLLLSFYKISCFVSNLYVIFCYSYNIFTIFMCTIITFACLRSFCVYMCCLLSYLVYVYNIQVVYMQYSISSQLPNIFFFNSKAMKAFVIYFSFYTGLHTHYRIGLN